MEKEIWKWILRQKSETELSEICKKLNIQVPGFRNGRVPNNLKDLVIRKILVPKKLLELKQKQMQLKEDWEEEFDFSEFNLDKFFSNTEIPPTYLLQRLLIDNKEQEASELFNKYLKELEELGLCQKEIKIRKNYGITTEKELSGKEIIQKNDNKHNKKIDKKLEIKLQKKILELEEVKQELMNYKEQVKIQNQNILREMQKLKKDFSLEKKKLKETIFILKNDKLHLISEKEKLIQEINELKKQKKEDSYTSSISENKVNFNNIKVALLGNPRNQKVLNSFNGEYKIVDNNVISTFNWKEYDEVWILTYRIDRNVANQLPTEIKKRIKIIDTFQQLKERIQKG